MKNEHVITHPSQLAGLSVLPLFRPAVRRQLRIDAPDIPDAAKQKWQQSLNRPYLACGCGEGAAGVFAALFAYAALMGLREGSFAGAQWSDTWRGVIALLVGAAVGKLIGLSRAQSELRKAIRAIRLEWDAPPIKSDGPALRCG